MAILFEDQRPSQAPSTNRADVAFFAGLIRRTGLTIPDDVRTWLRPLGMLVYPFALGPQAWVALMPANVLEWFLDQDWLAGLSSPASQLPALGQLKAPGVAAGDAQIVLSAPLTSGPPSFAMLDNEVVAVTAVDTTGTLLSVTRAAANTLAAAHSPATVMYDLTAAAFALLGTQIASGIPAAVIASLDDAGWLQGPFARELDQLADVPIPIDGYAGFTSMFDAGTSAASTGTDYVAVAVRSFFAQGGRRCYVVRMGDPVAPATAPADKLAALQSLLVGIDYTAGDPSTWHGAGHLAALVDVSYVALPDLPMLCAPPPAQLPPQPQIPALAPQFEECSNGDVSVLNRFPWAQAAPRLAAADYLTWAQSVAALLQYLVSGTSRQELHLREMQLVVAFPLPQDATDAASAALATDVQGVIQNYLPEITEPDGGIIGVNGTQPSLSSAFLQLTYPWLKTTGSSVLLESLEPPDGALAGILARNALTRGSFTSAVKVVPAEIYDLWPALPAQATKVSATPLVWDVPGSPQKALIERLSLFGPTPAGLRLLSDVTAYPGESYRSGAVKRLVDAISRAARTLGESLVFGRNGPALWARVESAMTQLMTMLWSANALDGATAADAFSVRCDSSTMTQNDLDNGRLIAEVTFTAAATIELIRVALTLETDGASTQQVAAVLAQAS